MKPTKFEGLILAITSLIILGTILISVPKINWQEALGQILLLPLIWVAFRYGRFEILMAVLMAMVIYIAIYIPSLLKIGLNSLLPRFIIRGLIYGGVSLSSLEIYHRFKYYLTKLENSHWIDYLTDLYTPQYLGRLIETYTKQHQRYQNIFSVLLFSFKDKVFPARREAEQTRLKELGEIIRKNVRNVDEVGRVNERKFGILLPHTDSYGASICGHRVHLCLSDHLKKCGFKLTGEELIEHLVLGYPEQKKEMENLIKNLKKSATEKE